MILLGVFLLTFAVVASTKGNDIVDYVDEKSSSWTKFDSLFKKYAAQYNLDWKDLKAISLVESDLGRYPSVAHGMKFPNDVEKSKSQDGKSWGLMQVTVTTAKDFDPTASPEKLNDPEYSVMLASKYLKMTRKYFSESDPRFKEFWIKSYNQGAGNTLKRDVKGLKGYADDYWVKFQKQLKRVMES